MSLIIVSGIPRSGTSMMMQMLEAAGVPVFHEEQADDFNPHGYYEYPEAMLGGLEFVPNGYAVKCLHKLAVQSRYIDAAVIVMRRDMDDILDSITRKNDARRKELGKFVEKPSPEFLQDSLDSVRLWCAGKPHIEVWYDDVLNNPVQECGRVIQFLGLDVDRLEDMVKVTLRRAS